ncbi:RNA 2',3'-cyclic phosphodiesterase [Deinococcus deserti]|uniref:RNA 2',3'-cyclic phosphodiesterase n=1 Tax=Deinococcus deserti (strain DSM 17065 / CIP 109153 / LMG 22923 / VCD115) TaxID=546414 RepID=C1CXY4_DEIDV|nr:RNA 2',3'-cyclic phosphodiesterase [Deinococcus deserti]ACO46940.1 putative 2`-5` RNA ligase [Deinococcus deserti VCD115]
MTRIRRTHKPAPRTDKPQRNTEPASQPLGPDVYEPAKASIKPAASPARQGGRGRSGDDEAPDRTLRLFYALRVPTDISGPLAEAQRALRGNWRAVRRDQMHVTLAYLPSVAPERLDDLKRLGALLTQDVVPMEVRLRGTGYFPNEGSPRVWFAKVEAEGLTELATKLREGIRNLDIQTDDLPFKAHITLARKKGPAPRVAPLTFDLGWQAGHAVLYRSILRKTGPIYETESTFRFRGLAPQETA